MRALHSSNSTLQAGLCPVCRGRAVRAQASSQKSQTKSANGKASQRGNSGSANATSPPEEPTYNSARAAVEGGDELFNKREFSGAVSAYRQAMKLRPNDDEARAAQYNMGCAHLKLEQWPRAMDCFQTAVNRYKLKVQVLYKVRHTAHAACSCFCACTRTRAQSVVNAEPVCTDNQDEHAKCCAAPATYRMDADSADRGPHRSGTCWQ